MACAILAGLLLVAFALELHVFVTLGMSGLALSAMFSDRSVLSILGDIAGTRRPASRSSRFRSMF